MNVISYFKNKSVQAQDMSLDEVLSQIKNGQYENEIDALRKAKENTIQYGLLKSKLPAFTPSGKFNGSHKLKNIVEYNPVIVLDIDKIGVEKASEVKTAAAGIEYTYAAFISPSGDGVKIFVKTDSTVKSHETAFIHLARYYDSQLDVVIDQSGKNISRLCFVSHDPDLFINEDAKMFVYSVNITDVPEFEENPYSTDLNEAFANIIAFTEKQDRYFPGNRNNFIFRLANNLNRAGIDYKTAEALVLSKYNDPDMKAEIPHSVANAYKNEEEHGIFSLKYFRAVSSVNTVTVVNSKAAISTPTIPEQIYEKLPKLLKNSASVFEMEREKDIYFTGAITILSGCFPNVYGIYDHKTVYLNIYSFIIAPPASGKNRLTLSRSLADKIHKKILEVRSANETIGDVLAAKNSPRTLFIPADSSSAAVKRTLGMNSGIGIICETEAETVSTTLKQDWGGYTNLLLKAFQHEPISYARAGEFDEVKILEIDCPKLSVCLSGTPIHVPGLIKSTADGLFSRFIFYNFKYSEKPVFKNVFNQNGGTNLTEYYNTLADEVFTLHEKVKEKEGIQIKLSVVQSERFQQHFNYLLSKIHDEFGEDSISSVFRLGLIVFRIAMLFTLLRKLENNELAEELECEDIDFESALQLSDVYLEHVLSVLQTLPGTTAPNRNAGLLWEFLPEQFTYSEAVKIGSVIMGISEKTTHNYLIELKENGWIKQPKKNGYYFNSCLQ